MDALLTLGLLGLPAAGVFALLASRMDWREAFAWSALAWAAYATTATWLLSIGAGHDLTAPRAGHLTRSGLLAAWIPPAFAGFLVLARERSRAAVAATAVIRAWRELDRTDRLLAAFTAFCVAAVGLVAIAAAPNNWDSMSYHLSRIEQWIRLGGVATYATHVEPQLYHPPGAEILVAQFRLLEGGDRFAAIVQWFAYAGSIAVASLCAARLGGSRRAQLVAAFIVATTPMAIMQGSSTQNDLVLALWLLMAGTLALGLRDGGAGAGSATKAILGASLALGLALLTKGTAYLFAPPVAALLAWSVVIRPRPRRAAALALVAIALILLPSVPHWLNNIDLYATPVAAGSGSNDYRTANAGPATVISNLVRNASIHMDMPLGGLNRAGETVVGESLGLIGIDANDRRTTFRSEPFRMGPFAPHEDHAGNLALLLLSVLAAGCVLTRSRFRTSKRIAWLIVIATQVLFFCALLVWQNWNARLHLPAFVLVAPLVAVVLAELRRERAVAVALALIAAATPLYLLYNYTRPLAGARSILTTPRERQYFYPRWQFEAPLRALTASVREHGYDKLGVIGPDNAWEYALQRFLPGVTVYGIQVANKSRKYAPRAKWPPAVACFDCPFGTEHALGRRGYVKKTLPSPALRKLGDYRTEFGTVILWTRD